MIATTEDEIQNLRKAGKLLADTLRLLVKESKVGTTAAELDLLAEKEIRAGGGVPSFLDYLPQGASYPYPAALCVSINDEIVHGIPTESRKFNDGDIVSLDLGLSYNKLYVDSAVTIVVGEGDEAAHTLIDATKKATMAGIKAAVVGGHIGDIGAAVEAVAKKGKFGIVEDLGGHAVGKAVHEKPFIANFGKKGTGEKIVEGMVLAIEPMLTEGEGNIIVDEDDWTYRTEDGSRAAHIEHTILVTKDGPEILTA